MISLRMISLSSLIIQCKYWLISEQSRLNNTFIIWLSRSIELRPVNAIKLIITMLWHLAKNAYNFWAGNATLSLSLSPPLLFSPLDPIMKRIIAKIALIAGRRAVSAARDIIYALKSRRDTRERKARFIRAVPCNSFGLPVRVKSDVEHVHAHTYTCTRGRCSPWIKVNR